MSDVTSVFFLQKPGLGVEQRELHLVADCSSAQAKASCRSGSLWLALIFFKTKTWGSNANIPFSSDRPRWPLPSWIQKAWLWRVWTGSRNKPESYVGASASLGHVTQQRSFLFVLSSRWSVSVVEDVRHVELQAVAETFNSEHSF